MTFIELIEDGRKYLGAFDFDHYPDCFSRFEADAGPLFDGLTADNSREVAETLVKELALCRSSLPRRAQKDAAYEQKQVLCLFLSPAARRHSATALSFAEQLRTLWCREQPKNGYLLGTYEQIMRGFDVNFLGMTLRKSSM